MEEAVKQLTLSVAYGIDAITMAIIAFAVAQATWRLARMLVAQTRGASAEAGPSDQQETVRLQLGRWLAIGLEFLLAADILRTAVAPTWDEIGKLAAIVVLRTVLNFFLNREIRDIASPHVDAVPRS